MPRHQRILSETGTYHVMMREMKKRTYFKTTKINSGFLKPCLSRRKKQVFLYMHIV